MHWLDDETRSDDDYYTEDWSPQDQFNYWQWFDLSPRISWGNQKTNWRVFRDTCQSYHSPQHALMIHEHCGLDRSRDFKWMHSHSIIISLLFGDNDEDIYHARFIRPRLNNVYFLLFNHTKVSS